MENYFAENLKKLRLYRKLSQNKLGELVGHNQTTIARWEDKVMSPSVDSVLKLCNIFDVDIATFLGRQLRIEDGVIINQHYGLIKVPVYDFDYTKTPVRYEEVSEDYMAGESWLALRAVEDIPEVPCKEGDLVIVSKKNPQKNDTVIYSKDYQVVFEPLEGATILGVVKEVRRIIE